MKCYSFFEGDSNPTSAVPLNLSTRVPTAHHGHPQSGPGSLEWLFIQGSGSLTIVEGLYWFIEGTQQAQSPEGGIYTHYLAVFLQGTHVKPHHRKRYSGREGRGTEQGLTPSSWALPTGLPYSRDPLPCCCQDGGYPLPSCLPGVRNPFTEEQGRDGTVWFWTTDGKLGKRVTNFLQWDRGR